MLCHVVLPFIATPELSWLLKGNAPRSEPQFDGAVMLSGLSAAQHSVKRATVLTPFVDKRI